MKLILRTVAILAVALVVVGAAVGISQLSGSSSQSSRPQMSGEVQLDAGSAPAGFHPDGGDREGGSTGGLADLGRSLFNVGWVLVVGAVALKGAKLVEGFYRRRQRLSVTPS